MRHPDLEMPIASTTGLKPANARQAMSLQESRAGANAEFLTAEEVSARYRGAVSVGTLRNWRAARIGPTFVKIGKSVLYPMAELEAWDRANLVKCRRQAPIEQPSREDA